MFQGTYKSVNVHQHFVWYEWGFVQATVGKYLTASSNCFILKANLVMYMRIK